MLIMNANTSSSMGGEYSNTLKSETERFYECQAKFYEDLICTNNAVMSVRVLGSYGRGDARLDSDLDVWVTARDDTPFNELYELWRQDLDKREQYQLDHGDALPAITRHGPSVFRDKESAAYLAGFLHRVMFPGELGEHILMHRVDQPELPVSYSNDDTLADMAIMLSDFLGNYWREVERGDIKLQKKWLARLHREVTYHTLGVRLRHDTDIFEDGTDEAAIVQKADELLSSLTQLAVPNLIQERRIIQSCLWTLEKVRWELFGCVEDTERWDRWRTGERTHLGFTPQEIGKLLRDCQQYLGESAPSVKRIGGLLVEAANPQDTQTHSRIPELHDELSKVLYEIITTLASNVRVRSSEPQTSVWPTLDSESRFIYRTGTKGAEHYLQTEIAAYEILDKQRIHFIETDDEGVIGVSVYAVEGVPMMRSGQPINIARYLATITDNHAHIGEYFGRLGAPMQFTAYEEYLIYMTNSLSSPIRRFAQGIIKEFGEALESEIPVLCHMDAGQHNVIESDNVYTLVDYEHATYCSPLWDIERAAVDLDESSRDAFLSEYYGTHLEHDPGAIFATRVAIAARLAHIPRYTQYAIKTLRSFGYGESL